MNFPDDPLADLSDGSDSFFDDPKPASKRASLTKTPEKKSITDIFNITPQSTEVQKKSEDWLGLDSKDSRLHDVRKSPIKTPKVVKKISFEDDDDLLGNLGLSKRPSSKTEATLDDNKPANKKLDLLESIMGPSKIEEKKTPPSFDNILKESKAISGISATSLLQGDNVREGRRGRRPSATGLMDPLGLFSSESEPKTPLKQPPEGAVDIFKNRRPPSPKTPVEMPKATMSQSAPNIHEQSLPDWLGGPTLKQSKSENAITQKFEDPIRAEIPQEVNVSKDNFEAKHNLFPTADDNEAIKSLLTQQKLAQSHIEYQNTATALQQQESQLLMALQLKKYDENLMQMQQKQQNILLQQEKQFNDLLERQFARQQIMENNMRLQQERINNHIQMLISQPSIVGQHPEQEQLNELKKTSSEESEKLYENIISQLKQRQHEETFLLEESYKKQVTLLEQTLEATEKRLKSDIEKLYEIGEEKMNLTNQQHQDELSKHRQKIQDLESQHLDEIKQIRDGHNRTIEEIKYEQATVLENIKQAKQSETTLFSESTLYSQKLDSNIEVLFNNSKSLQELRANMDKDFGAMSRAREESLKAKEQEIVSMRTTLEKCRESAEKERAELLGLVRSLEMKISEQNQNGREERWTFQQAASVLAARSAAMDRESEFNRVAIEREREQIKTLKESLLAEQEKMILQLTEEKLAISAEKSRLEISAKLNSNFDSQKAKAETEAAIKIAQEAAELTDKERQSLHRDRCELEKLKRILTDQERKLTSKESELENLMREADSKMKDAEKAISESKLMERRFNERMRNLQNDLVLLTNREKRLAEEKIVLSKERLALNVLAKQSKSCRLCADDPQKLDSNAFEVSQANRYFLGLENVDSDIIRLRLEAIDDNYPNIEENFSK